MYLKSGAQCRQLKAFESKGRCKLIDTQQLVKVSPTTCQPASAYSRADVSKSSNCLPAHLPEVVVAEAHQVSVCPSNVKQYKQMFRLRRWPESKNTSDLQQAQVFAGVLPFALSSTLEVLAVSDLIS